MTKSGTTTVLVSIMGIWLTAGSAAAPPDVSEISQGAASAMGVSGAEAEAAPWSDGDAAEDEGSVAGGRFTCCGCNPPPFGNCDCCGGFCVCEANCPGTFCNGLCPGGNFCNPGCSNECNEAICPGNVACNPRCGGNPCGPGCVCDPACPTTRCNPLCPGGSLCGPGCVNECDSFFCRDNHCNPQRCPEEARCDGTCGGGNYCNPGCSTECDHDLCYGNWLCEPVCGGYPCLLGCNPGPCGPGCATECDSILCRENHCNPQRCPEQARCDGTCAGGNYCNPGCSTECDHDLCYGNWLCEPVCGGYPCLLGCNPGPCEPGCATECDSFFCIENHCNPQRCPEEARCDGLCAVGNYCNPGCSTECDPFLCPGNIHCNPICDGHPCNLGCNPGPCGEGCPSRCDPVICPSTACSSACPGVDACNLLCGGDPCEDVCADQCNPFICPKNALCGNCLSASPCDPLLCPEEHCDPQWCPDPPTDWRDVQPFLSCMDGPGEAHSPTDCVCNFYDRDGDSDVDLLDAAELWVDFGGP